MGRLASLRRYDVQADYAFGLSMLSVIPFVAALLLAVRNYEPELGQIVYGAKGMFLSGFTGCALASLFLGGTGFALGWSSAGQRRNDRPARSWIGFFLGGIVLTGSLILLIALLMLRLPQPAG